MRLIRLIPALALAIVACSGVSAQPAPQKTPAAPPAKPYKTVVMTFPATLSDPSFDIMRLHLGEAAERKDRAALARLVVRQGFFWDRENGDGADKRKSGVDN